MNRDGSVEADPERGVLSNPNAFNVAAKGLDHETKQASVDCPQALAREQLDGLSRGVRLTSSLNDAGPHRETAQNRAADGSTNRKDFYLKRHSSY